MADKAPKIVTRRGLKDTWPSPELKGGPAKVNERAHGHTAEPRGRRKFV